MGARDFALLLRKWVWLIVLLTVLVAGISFVISRRSTPIYQATATLMVNQAAGVTAPGYSDILTSERLARTYANLLTGWQVLAETSKRLGIDPKYLGTVTVTPVRDTQLLDVKVEGPSPTLVVDIANTLPQVFIEQNQAVQLGRVSQSKATLEREISNTEADIARTQAALQNALDDVQRSRLETSLAQYRSTYSNLVAGYQQIKLAEAQSTANLVLSEPAVVPVRPIRPRVLFNTLIAAIVGAILGFAVVLLIDYLDDTVKTADDIYRTSGLSTLGAIARLRDLTADRQLVTWLHSKAPESEAYRTLRTNIQFSSVDKPVHTLLVTSSGPGEGKSTTAANLALVMAQTGQRVILVDTDLRRPVMHRIFGAPNNVGMTTALLSGDNIILDQYLQATEVNNLSVLTSGPTPPNPSELLGSHRMAALIDRLSEAADIVIFDSPPVLAVTDAAVLGRQVDGVLLVVDAGKTRDQALNQATSELEKTGAHLLGVALNRLDNRSRGYYYYYYYYSDESGGQKRHSSSGRGGGFKLRWPWPRKAL